MPKVKSKSYKTNITPYDIKEKPKPFSYNNRIDYTIPDKFRLPNESENEPPVDPKTYDFNQDKEDLTKFDYTSNYRSKPGGRPEITNAQIYTELEGFEIDLPWLLTNEDDFSRKLSTSYSTYVTYKFQKWLINNNVNINILTNTFNNTHPLGDKIYDKLGKYFIHLWFVRMNDDLFASYKYINSLTPEQKQILRIYVDPQMHIPGDINSKNYVIINDYLRSQAGTCPSNPTTFFQHFVHNFFRGYPSVGGIDLVQFINSLLDIFKNSPKTTSTINVYRCDLTPDNASRLSVSSSITFFMSTSLSKNYSLQFCDFGFNVDDDFTLNGTMKIIQILPGNNILYLDSGHLYKQKLEGDFGTMFYESEILLMPLCFLEFKRTIEETFTLYDSQNIQRSVDVNFSQYVLNPLQRGGSRTNIISNKRRTRKSKNKNNKVKLKCLS